MYSWGLKATSWRYSVLQLNDQSQSLSESLEHLEPFSEHLEAFSKSYTILRPGKLLHLIFPHPCRSCAAIMVSARDLGVSIKERTERYLRVSSNW